MFSLPSFQDISSGRMKTNIDSNSRIIILGVGNTLLSDEGLGVHVVNELSKEYEFDKNVSCVDGGALSAQLIPVIKEADYLIVVDALEAQDEPGSIYKFTYKDIKTKQNKTKTSLHEMSIIEILNMVETIGALPQTTIIGVQPADIETYKMDCTDKIKAKFPSVKEFILKELDKIDVNYKKA